MSEKRSIHLEDRDSDSEPEIISVARTSTPVKITSTTNSKTIPVNSRNTHSHPLLYIMMVTVVTYKLSQFVSFTDKG